MRIAEKFILIVSLVQMGISWETALSRSGRVFRRVQRRREACGLHHTTGWNPGMKKKEKETHSRLSAS